MAPDRPDFDASIADYYRLAPEEQRLDQGAFLLEAIRTRELIQRYAPPPPATVFDIGGAAGAYAFWLAEAGYAVHLIDASPRLVDEARRRGTTHARPLASWDVGDARALPFADGSADVALLLGPLYHLTKAEDRMRALLEAARVLRPGGLAMIAAISRWASSLDGLARNLFVDVAFTAIVERDLIDGQHRNPTGRLDYFTTAYFHRPEELRAEILGAGLALEGIFGIEGPAWLLGDIDARLDDPRKRADLLRVARSLEREPSALGLSAHWLAVARKANGRESRV